MKRSTLLALLCCTFLSILGCGKLGQALDEFQQAIDSLNKLQQSLNSGIEVVNKASGDWQGQSEEWRKSIGQMQQDFDDANEKLLGQTLQNTADRIISHANVKALADIEYLQIKFTDQFKFLSAAIDNAKKQLSEAKKSGDKSKIKAILDGVAQTKIWDDPFIISFEPNYLAVGWTDWRKTKFVIASERLIEVSGWGFDRPAGETLTLEMTVRGADGKERPFGTVSFQHQTNYLLQITFTDEVKDLRLGDTTLIFQCGSGLNNRRELSLTWKDAPKPLGEGPKHAAWRLRWEARNWETWGETINGRGPSEHVNSMAPVAIGESIVGIDAYAGEGVDTFSFVVRRADGTLENRPDGMGFGDHRPSGRPKQHADVPPGDFIIAYSCESGEKTDSWTFYTHKDAKLRIGGPAHPKSSPIARVVPEGGKNALRDGQLLDYELVGGDVTYGITVDTFRGRFRPHFTPEDLREPGPNE